MANCITERQEHEKRIKALTQTMPCEEDIYLMASRFKALSEPSRLKILLALEEGELCVEHLCGAVNGNQSAVSHQLKALKDCKIIKSRRCGKNILYSISDEHILIMLKMAKEHLDCDE